MPSEYELTISRYQTFLRDVLDPQVYGDREALGVEVIQLKDPAADPIDAAAASGMAFEAVSVPWAWGPKWSTAWFRISGVVPARMRGRRVCARFSSGTEGQLWTMSAGVWVPHQGLDVNRDRIDLFESAAGGEAVSLLIEAACNHPFGVLGFEWDHAETLERWKGELPGRLERAELAVFDEAAWRLRHSYAFLLGLLKELPQDHSRAQDLLGVLRRATNAVTPAWAGGGGAAEAQAILDEAMARRTGASATECHAVGHAHIDTAWLWTTRETRRKCLRSFSNQLRLMEKFHDHHFLCSQAQQYAWVEERSPRLFEEIAARVAEGRWEPGGAMWIEPDANCPSGESLVRQILHGTRYWVSRFGERGRQTFLYLPDTFGFPASLPQIMAGAGLTTFITNKMIWSRYNVFPHTTFVWRGIDGSEVLAHNTPGHDYNAVNTPKELRKGELNHRNRSHPTGGDAVKGGGAPWLQPFGYGDGGGGPTDWSILNARMARDCEGLPRVTMGRVDEFCGRLEELDEATAGTPDALPTWWGELYLEIHRGTLTTQAWIKQANRRAEEDLRFAELLTSAGPGGMSAGAAAKLEKAWKTLLLNQFHDILPGSSIGEVYRDARRDFVRIGKVSEALIEQGTSGWLEGMSTVGMRRPMGVFNPCSTERSGVIELEDALAFARGVPAIGVRVVDRDAPSGCVPCRVEAGGDHVRMSNGLIAVALDDAGRVVSLRREEPGAAEMCGTDATGQVRAMNQLVLYEDVPHMWDAWDIDPWYEHKGFAVETEAEAIEVVSEEALRVAVRFSRSLASGSRMEQTYTLDAASPRVDIHTRVWWKEKHVLLRAVFPTGLMAAQATYEIQFGHVQRPTHRNTSWDAAMFEVCGHRWMDLSERGAGLALLNDCKYGHSCHDGVMGLSLLRGPTFPDPGADEGEHEFTYSLMPHGGDWRGAGVDREAEALNTPMVAYALNPGEDGRLGTAWAPMRITCEGTAAVHVAAVKKAEGDDRLIVRLWESHGGRGRARIAWKLPVGSVEAVDLLENAIEAPWLSHEGGETVISLRPFAIVSIAVRLR